MEWYERETLHCKNRYRSFMMRGMTEYFFPVFGGKAMTDVTAEDIMSAIEPLRQSGKLRGGRRLTDVCGQICRYAVANGRPARFAAFQTDRAQSRRARRRETRSDYAEP